VRDREAEIARAGQAIVGEAQAEAPEVPGARADANSFVVRKSANSASSELKTSITKITGCSASLWLRAARSCRGG
jgi:hypothetical protein